MAQESMLYTPTGGENEGDCGEVKAYSTYWVGMSSNSVSSSCKLTHPTSTVPEQSYFVHRTFVRLGGVLLAA